MKVFISHQLADAQLAANVAYRLRLHHTIDSYLDVVDPVASQTGDDLGDYLRAQLDTCTQLMAVVSSATKLSWWVPWEIGVATEKDYPISTYAGDQTPIPEYLKKWPYLRNMSELDVYASVSKRAETLFESRRKTATASVARRLATKDFYNVIRSRLGQ